MRRSLWPVVLICCLALVACGSRENARPGDDTEPDLSRTADRLAKTLLIVDTHVDVPYRLQENMDDISVRTEDGHFDFPRARAGGLDAPFMSIYVPASYQNSGGAKELADELIDMVEKFEADWPDKFAVARSPEDLRENFDHGIISLPLGIENGAPIEDDLANLQHFYDRGVRYITLTHSEDNQICDSSYSDEQTWGGLSPFGERVVAEMNRLGIMVDVSHVSDQAFYDVLELTRAPVIASHSSCRKYTPDWERNISDEMIVALADNGGVVHINFGSAFLRQDAQEQSTEFWNGFRAFLEDNGIESDHEDAKRYREEYWNEREQIFGNLDDVAMHIDHVVELVGIDHVGFGSDFDGVSALPDGLKDVSYFPDLIAALLQRGYSEEDIEKICSGNLLRVWNEARKVAEQLQQQG